MNKFAHPSPHIRRGYICGCNRHYPYEGDSRLETKKNYLKRFTLHR